LETWLSGRKRLRAKELKGQPFRRFESYRLRCMPESTTQLHTDVRPPVVVVLGHVDHGKTALLDTIRKTNVAGGESGGITQHIGAYQVEVHGKKITFLDTPGHEAFTAIRSRGAKVADIAILVVAADEGVKPQTKEAIRIIKEAEIPVIVAINKIDKEGSNPQKVRQDLASEEIQVEDWGGKVPVVEISAKENLHISDLLDMILLVAELEELTASKEGPAQGIIIESNLDKRRGYVATALVRDGILRVGDWVVVGRVVGKVKSMEDYNGKAMTEAGPSDPVLITGWPDSPDIGKEFKVVNSRNDGDDMVADSIDISPLLFFMSNSPKDDQGDKKLLNLVLKSDVTSSLEAIDAALKSIPSTEVSYNVLDYSIGNITEGDVKVASGTKAMILGFRVNVEDSAKRLAEQRGITIATYDIIYELIGRVRDEMSKLLSPQVQRNELGKLRILAIFKKDSKSIVCGGRVTSGKLVRGCIVDVKRNNDLVMTGRLAQLQQNKEDVTEVKEGLEAGIRFDILKSANSSSEIKEGDILEAYEEENIQRSL
jgi:translation initiation factor IF-2